MKNKIIMAALAIALSTSASAEVLRKKAIICDTPWQLEKVLAAASTGNGTFMNVIKNVGCQLNKNDLNVVPMMQWPGQEMMVKVMVSDPAYPKLAGLEVWTDIIFFRAHSMNSTNPNFKEWFQSQVDKIKQEKEQVK